jgi:hypothetical protein
MAQESNEEAVNGLMVAGSDGAIYFIPSDRLGEFRVPDEGTEKTRESLENLDSEVAGFSMLSFDLKPGVTTLKAFEGPLGVKDLSAVVKKTKTMYNLGATEV